MKNIPSRMLLHGFLMGMLLLSGCKDKGTDNGSDVFQLLKTSAGDITLSSSRTTTGVSADAVFEIEFSASVDTQTVQGSISLATVSPNSELPINFSFGEEAKRIEASPAQALERNAEFTLTIKESLKSAGGSTFPGISYDFRTRNGQVELISATVNGEDLTGRDDLRDVNYDVVDIELTFSEALDAASYQSYFNITPSVSAAFEYFLSADGKTLSLTNSQALDYYRHYNLSISENLTAENGFEFSGFEGSFQTGLDPTFKFPQISDEVLLTKVQEQTFKYFWDFAHPVSGMARERNSSGDVVTTGGSGFGLMAIVTGIHRGFITRSQGVERLQTIVDFLGNADRFHGVWPHWMNGSTGDAIAFSTYDDGGDLVETAFMAQGLITVRQFLDENDAAELTLINDINTLLDDIEWSWYTRGGQNVLYWHWSPNHDWRMNMPVKGYNEALIVYVLAAASSEYGIEPEAYHEGWASSGSIENGNEYYGYTLPVGFDFGGPLFFAHYSFLGLDPRSLSDTYADYWTQNVNHTLINRAYSVANQGNYVGYRTDSWGLTASDDPEGYLAHEPNRDNGTITPTAALSSMPYTPEESMEVLKHFYYVLGDKLWGPYGFYDAFNPTEGWWANSYLAIDQGPIIIMIENHRSGLLWDLFMSAPEVQTALTELGFNTQ